MRRTLKELKKKRFWDYPDPDHARFSFSLLSLCFVMLLSIKQRRMMVDPPTAQKILETLFCALFFVLVCWAAVLRYRLLWTMAAARVSMVHPCVTLLGLASAQLGCGIFTFLHLPHLPPLGGWHMYKPSVFSSALTHRTMCLIQKGKSLLAGGTSPAIDSPVVPLERARATQKGLLNQYGLLNM